MNQNIKDEIIEGFGSYIYPLVSIIKKDDLISHEVMITKQYKNHIIDLENTGFILVRNSNKQIAKKIINEILSGLLLQGHKVYSIRDDDISYEKLNQINGDWDMNRTIRGLYFLEQEAGYAGERSLISKTQIIKTFNFLKRKSQNDKFGVLLRILLQSYTHLKQNEYNSSFIMSWTIIEQYIGVLWNNYLHKKNFKKKREKKLKNNPNYLSTDHKIEILSMLDYINLERYNKFIQTKRIRNNFLHKLTFISEENAQKSLNFAKALIIELNNSDLL